MSECKRAGDSSAVHDRSMSGVWESERVSE